MDKTTQETARKSNGSKTKFPSIVGRATIKS